MPINKTRLKIAVLKWHPGLPGANESRDLRQCQIVVVIQAPDFIFLFHLIYNLRYHLEFVPQQRSAAKLMPSQYQPKVNITWMSYVCSYVNEKSQDTHLAKSSGTICLLVTFSLSRTSVRSLLKVVLSSSRVSKVTLRLVFSRNSNRTADK